VNICGEKETQETHHLLPTFSTALLSVPLSQSWSISFSLATQTISFIEFSKEAGILLGGEHEACFVLGVTGIEPMQS
jgi:hypothetical protein